MWLGDRISERKRPIRSASTHTRCIQIDYFHFTHFQKRLILCSLSIAKLARASRSFHSLVKDFNLSSEVSMISPSLLLYLNFALIQFLKQQILF